MNADRAVGYAVLAISAAWFGWLLLEAVLR